MNNNIFHLPSAILHLPDCEELVKILVHRCKKINDDDNANGDKKE